MRISKLTVSHKSNKYTVINAKIDIGDNIIQA